MWRITWSNRTLADMERLDRGVRGRIFRALDRLTETGHGDLKRLQGHGQDLRLRVGDWRVRLAFEVENGAIRIHRVRHRREAYRE